MVNMNRTFSLTANGPTPPAAVAIYRGQHDQDDAAFAGPVGGAGDAAFVSPNGADLHPTGSGEWVYVDAAASGANNGTSPTDAYTTIQAAVSAASAGDCILIEPGVYPESVNLANWGSNPATATDRVKLSRRGAGKVQITGADAVGTWTQATNGQADGNPNWANLYWSDFTPSADVAVGDAVLLQSGVLGAITMLGDGMSTTDDMLLPQHKTLWWDGTDGGSQISDLVKSGNTGTITITSSHFETYPQGYLDGCEIWLNLANNEAYFVTIDSHNAATGQIVFTLPGGKNWTTEQMALRNVLSQIGAPGQWGYRDNGDGSYRVWFWPYDSGTLSETRISTRQFCVDVNSAQNFTLYGIDMVGAGGEFTSNSREGCGIRFFQKNTGGYNPVGNWIEECRAESCVWLGMDLSNGSGTRVYNCSVEKIISGKGFIFDSCSDSIYAYLKTDLTGSTAVSVYGQTRCAFLYSSVGEVRSVHGNGVSNYNEFTNGFWAHGNEIGTGFAIGATQQDGGNAFWTCNVMKLGPGIAERGFEDNSNLPSGYDRSSGGGYSTVEALFPTPPMLSWVCNTVLPWAGAADSESTTSIQYMNTTRCEHYLGGNAIFGNAVKRNGTITNTAPDPDVVYNATLAAPEAGNVFVGTAMTGNALLSNGGGNTLAADPDAVWVNPVSDPTPVASGPLDGTSGDHTAYLPLGEAWVSDLGILSLVQQDYNGTAINYATAPRGAVAT